MRKSWNQNYGQIYESIILTYARNDQRMYGEWDIGMYRIGRENCWNIKSNTDFFFAVKNLRNYYSDILLFV